MNKFLTRFMFKQFRTCRLSLLVMGVVILSCRGLLAGPNPGSSDEDDKRKHGSPNKPQVGFKGTLTIQHNFLDDTAIKYIQMLEAGWHQLDHHFNVQTKMQLQARTRQANSIFIRHEGYHVPSSPSQKLTEYGQFKFKVTQPLGALIARRDGWDIRLEFILASSLSPKEKDQHIHSLLSSFLRHESSGSLQIQRALVIVPYRDFYSRVHLELLFKERAFNLTPITEPTEDSLALEALSGRSINEFRHPHNAQLSQYHHVQLETVIGLMDKLVDSTVLPPIQSFYEIRGEGSPSLNRIFKKPVTGQEILRNCWSIIAKSPGFPRLD